MKGKLKVGDKVTWKYRGNTAKGTIEKVHTKDFQFNGDTRHASEDDPQYEIKSSTTGHMAAHKASALTKEHETSR